jgi:hypothetical protein
MRSSRRSASLNSRVPVSTTGDPSPELESQARPVGLNPLHEARLITQLVDHYGWSLCADGNLYNPYPSASQMRGDAA